MNISKIYTMLKTHFIPLWNMYIVRWVQTSCNSPLLLWLIAEVRKFVCIICKTESRGSSLIFCRPFVNEATRAGSNVVGTLFHKNKNTIIILQVMHWMIAGQAFGRSSVQLKLWQPMNIWFEPIIIIALLSVVICIPAHFSSIANDKIEVTRGGLVQIGTRILS